MAGDEATKENSGQELGGSRLLSALGPAATITHAPTDLPGSSDSPPSTETPAITCSAQSDLVVAENIPETPGTFVRFPKLPLELRLKIWRYSFRKPRHITVTTNVCPKSKNRKLGSNQEPPVTLLVCKESRFETLVPFIVIPIVSVKPPEGIEWSPTPHSTVHQFALDPEVESLGIHAKTFSPKPGAPTVFDWLKESNKERLWLPQIQMLEIVVDFYSVFRPGKEGTRELNIMKKTLFRFTNLKEIHFFGCCYMERLTPSDALEVFGEQADAVRAVATQSYRLRLEKSKLKIHKLLEKSKYHFTGGQAPVVSIESPQTIPTERLSEG
ncbi:hypothetical protein DL98DRAFT_528782 [Cadophora sp. DSE1049]|nr:hypothetical protein DL98DRAFT_528782 [Cadophora sp. DSE1049]